MHTPTEPYYTFNVNSLKGCKHDKIDLKSNQACKILFFYWHSKQVNSNKKIIMKTLGSPFNLW